MFPKHREPNPKFGIHRGKTMQNIHRAIVTLARFSKHRTSKVMRKEDLKKAFEAGADFIALNINGIPCRTYCSCRDFKGEAVIQISEIVNGRYETAAHFVYRPFTADHDIPNFMEGSPVEMD